MNLVIPAIRTLQPTSGSFLLAAGIPVIVTDPALTPVAARFVADLEADTGIALQLTAPGVDAGADAAAGIRIERADTGLDTIPAAGGLRADGDPGADERYGIEITVEGVRLWARTPEGAHRALTTLRQLAIADAELPGGRILDGPRFAWRGLSLDVARTFHGPETVRGVIDMLALHKLNVLHLHLSDNEGWRIEVPGRPALSKIGGAGATGDRPGGWYSPAEVAELVAYAAERFVTVVPEIDMPGHVAAVFRALPELGTSEVLSVGPLGLPIGFLDPEKDATWTFVADVLDALVAQFPQSAYLHLGGDEAFGMPEEAHAAFVERAKTLVEARGKHLLGWQEIARSQLGEGDVIQFWMERGVGTGTAAETAAAMLPAELLPLILDNLAKADGDVPAALAQGAAILVSPTNRLYFDRPHAAASLDPVQEERRAHVGLPMYEPASLRDGVEWDPVDETPGVHDDSRLAGIEAAVWCETITDRNDLEMMLLPRLAGAAEKAWGAQGTTGWDDYARRLAAQSPAWDRRGWNWFRSGEVAWPVDAAV